MIRRILCAILPVLALVVTSCSDPGPSPEVVTVTETFGAETSTDVANDEWPSLGEKAVSGGATLVITSVHRAPSLDVCPDNYKCGFRPNETLNARDGGEFIVLESEIENNSQRPMDLTCGLPIANSLFNIEEQAYTAINELYRIPDNPECNEQLQPGFTDNMNWVYEVPAGTELGYFEFSEINNVDMEGDTAYIDLSDATIETGARSVPENNKVDSEPPVDEAEGVPQDIQQFEPDPIPAPEEPAVVDTYSDPVIGMTEAPGISTPSLMNKVVQSCGDTSMHETGTTFFTDGSTGWTQQCADQTMAG